MRALTAMWRYSSPNLQFGAARASETVGTWQGTPHLGTLRLRGKMLNQFAQIAVGKRCRELSNWSVRSVEAVKGYGLNCRQFTVGERDVG